MAVHLSAVCFAARDPRALARFWSALLGWDAEGDTVLPGEPAAFPIRFFACTEPKAALNRAHFDLTSASLNEQRRTVDRALRLGATHLDVGQLPEEEHVVLADPEGNEFCVIEPGNAFLDGCGAIGAFACDGSRAAGLFWAAALDWPLVWDEGEETAVQSPGGGPKISWSGDAPAPRTGTDRVRFDLAPDGDERAEVDRLVSLGATSLDVPAEPGWATLADPDGNAFRVPAGRR